MMQVLEFYVSGFWTWLGITIGLGMICGGARNALVFGLNVWRS
ncbi:hypothetical protein [Mesorhizobium sp. WSM3866]|nr:hypothetical protein [Mesorhizobium sp. WSM3866]